MPNATASQPETKASPHDALGISLGLQIVWFGLLGGFAELIALGVQNAIRHTITVETIRTNHHRIWMIPVAGVMLTAVVGGLLALTGRFFPRIIRSVSPYVLSFVGCLMPLLAIRGLYSVACVALAAGLACRIGAFAWAHPIVLRSVTRYSLPVMLVLLALIAGIKGSDVIFSEHRAIANLPAARPRAKNVILLVMDNVRADHLSLYGYSRDTSPALEKIAASGVRFDRARSPAPWTLPSHASMLTGLWPHQLSTSIDSPLNDTPPTLAETLADQGYLTGGFVGNTFYCNSWYGLDRGFSRYEDFAENRHINLYEIFRSSLIGDRILSALNIELATPGDKDSRKTAAGINKSLLGWIDKRGDRPFFAFVNYYDAHEPFSPPDGYLRRYGLSALDAPSRRAISKRFRNLSRGTARSLDLAQRTEAQIIDEAKRLTVDGYDDCIRYLDTQIGRLIDDLRSRGLLENTIVVITSDHGEHFGERGLHGHGNSLYRPLIDVPLIVLGPGVPGAGHIVNDLVSPRDIPATILDLIDPQKQQPLPGESLARLWSDDSPRELSASPPLSQVEYQPKLAPASHVPAAMGPVWSIAANDRVYIRHGSGREELYNIEEDPLELNDLSEETAERMHRNSLRERMDQILNESPHEKGGQ